MLIDTVMHNVGLSGRSNTALSELLSNEEKIHSHLIICLEGLFS